MRWEDFRSSTNIEDRRGGGFGIPGGAGGIGVIGTLVLGLIGYALGIDPRLLIGAAEQAMNPGAAQHEQAQRPQERPQGGARNAPQDQAGRFAAAILGNTEDVFKGLFPQQVNREYRPPGMVIFSGATPSACGTGQSAMGPFYCPMDRKVYIDLSFFEEMARKFRAGGDFAYAYVIAHEVGHHIENELGILERVQARKQQVGRAEANQLSVRVELMADCLAGVWAHHSNQRWQSLEPGDIEEGIRAAEAIGDDRLQRQSGGRVVPDSFTHGSSEQRARWLRQGLNTGTIQSCDTFRASRL